MTEVGVSSLPPRVSVGPGLPPNQLRPQHCKNEILPIPTIFRKAWRTLAASAGVAGDIDTAAAALTEARQLQPDLSVAWIEKHHPIVHPEDRAIYIKGLRAAGHVRLAWMSSSPPFVRCSRAA